MPDYTRIKQLLKEEGHTQTELAHHMGLAPATVNQKLNGVRPLSLEEANSIAQFLGISDAAFGSYFFKS